MARTESSTESPAFTPPNFTPKDPEFEARVRASFGRQGIMTLVGARMTRVEPGLVEIDFDTARRLFTLICVLHIRG